MSELFQEKARPSQAMPVSPECTTLVRPILSVLIPVFNEQRTICQVIDKLLNVHFLVPVEIVIVDDGSTDDTARLLRSLHCTDEFRVFFHTKNSGKGAAVQTAISHARGEFVVVQDADLELDPKDLLDMLDVVISGQADVCYGSRFMGGVSKYRTLPTYWANRFLNWMCNMLNGICLTDMNTCYKMMRTEIARQIDLTSRGFEMEPEITTKLARMGVRIVERPVKYDPRARQSGKKIRATDFFRYLRAMICFRFFR